MSSADASKPKSEGSTETVGLSRSATARAGRGEQTGERDARNVEGLGGRDVVGVRSAARTIFRSPERVNVAVGTGQHTGNGTRTEDEVMQLGIIGLGKGAPFTQVRGETVL